MILITGATGTVGQELVQQMIKIGQPMRLLVRDPRKVAALNSPGGLVQIAVGDLDKPETIESAVQGVERIFLVTSSTRQDADVLTAAKHNGVRQIVKLSTIEAGHEPIIGNGKWHHEQEELIRASGLVWTFLRPTMFMNTTLEWASTIRAQGSVNFPGGEGRIAPVDPWDIAAVAGAALTSPGYEYQAYPLTGPELLNFSEMTGILAKVLGKPITYEDIPEGTAAAGMLKAGLPEYVVNGLVEVFSAVRAGRFAYLTEDVERITGNPPMTFEAWCRQHAAAFQ